MPIFGCVADDFTGASDAASFLVKGGMSVQLFNGISQESFLEHGLWRMCRRVPKYASLRGPWDSPDRLAVTRDLRRLEC